MSEIPWPAIEAAAREMYKLKVIWGGNRWEDTTERNRIAYRREAEAILRAAAPAMLNAAADEIMGHAEDEDQEPSHSMALTFAARLVRARAEELPK